jgi:hypothetical protein
MVREIAPATPPAMNEVDVGEVLRYSDIRVRHVYASC